MLPYFKYNCVYALVIFIVRSKPWTVPLVKKLPMKRTAHVFMLFVLATLVGCASGSALVTGQVRPPIEDHKNVSILTEMPDGSQLIAIVKASSDSGWTQQGSLDYAVDELKKQAAKVGANAVVLSARDTSTQTAGVPTKAGGTFIGTFAVEIVQGTAIWVN